MGFEIPEPFCWDETFCVFYENIDAEHKGLFKGIFECSKKPGDGALLGNLLAAVQSHFATEEAMFAKANFDGAASHKQVHDEFVAKLKTLSTPLDDATVNFAKDWLVNHIKGIDFKYKGKL